MLRQHTMTVTIGLAGGLLLLAVLVSLVGWGGGAPQNAPEPVERVRTERLLAGLTSAPDTLDPHTATTRPSSSTRSTTRSYDRGTTCSPARRWRAPGRSPTTR
jgi:ABC-type transport system substrate-binding protein